MYNLSGNRKYPTIFQHNIQLNMVLHWCMFYSQKCSTIPISKSKYVPFIFRSHFPRKRKSLCERSVYTTHRTVDNFYQTSIYYSEKCLKFSVAFFDRYRRNPLTNEILVYGFYGKWNFVIFKLFKSYSKHTLLWSCSFLLFFVVKKHAHHSDTQRVR